MGFSRQEYWSGVPLPSPFRRSNMVQRFYPQVSWVCLVSEWPRSDLSRWWGAVSLTLSSSNSRGVDLKLQSSTLSFLIELSIRKLSLEDCVSWCEKTKPSHGAQKWWNGKKDMTEHQKKLIISSRDSCRLSRYHRKVSSPTAPEYPDSLSRQAPVLWAVQRFGRHSTSWRGLGLLLLFYHKVWL